MALDGISHVTIDDFDTVDEVTEDVTSGGQELVLQKWELPALWSVTVTPHLATELPVPDEYPYEAL